MRFDDYKVLYVDQEKWFRSPQTILSTPYIINLKLDPFERLIHARGYDQWCEDRSYMLGPAAKYVHTFLNTFKDFPPSHPSVNVKVSELGEKMIQHSSAMNN